MSWSAPSGHVFTTGEVVTAATMNTYIKDNLIDLDRRATALQATVDTSQTTTSTSYTDLTTAGPAVTAATGTEALVICTCYMLNSGGANVNYMSAAVSSATTSAATDVRALYQVNDNAITGAGRASAATLFTGLNAGSNIFTAKYKVSAGTGTFSSRQIIVVPLLAA